MFVAPPGGRPPCSSVSLCRQKWHAPAGLLSSGHRFTSIQRKTMPTYHVEMMEGRTLEQKKKLVAEITRVSVDILGGAPDSVDVIITDIKRENWSTGGKLWSEPRD
ncbi:MAG: 4-oxalocrotonate tautomerase [Polaromonas sp.]|nr:4-oxalocrotonate tautomerase [Polaromonas sp.]MDI1271686.1 4-oxalocrotonate tautomerase [Polaromonas sp.]MDO9115926.1 4-oxalocrotonate tautomerase [Polaromonas sp.]MDP1888557.1 4-oxalocrotonate tautomerase [Polaromonas sp.]MDP2449820.1 4-oxalocrotonate tautomerase [Polaromonas sp.]MDP3246322.1 4-oxalocrotonate tautomerase [Polaromonas sp.]